MFSSQALTPKERKKLSKYMHNVRVLGRMKKLEPSQKFIMRQQARAVFILLSVKDPDKVLIANGISIMQDVWGFKEYRLRKLIGNGRRSL